MNNHRAHNAGLLVLRLGIGAVFFLFGIDKLQEPSNWIIYIPNQLGQTIQSSGLVSVMQFLRAQGFVETILGLQIACGCLARWSSAGACLLLATIVAIIGLDQTGIRDFGLLSAAIALTFLGPGDWSIDAWLNRKR